MLKMIARFLLPATLSIAMLATTAPAPGQSLAERVRAVRQKREQEKNGHAARLAVLQAVIHSRITVDFEGTPARDAFEFIGSALGVTLLGRYRDDLVGHGIDPETPITLALENAAVPLVLDEVLEQCSGDERCTWQVRGSFLEVGTRERLSAAGAQEVRIYPVAALLFEPPHFDDAPSVGIDYGPYNYDPYYDRNGGFTGGRGLSGSIQIAPAGGSRSAGRRVDRGRELVDLIVETIEPEAWQQNGGAWASIRYREGALVVRAPDFIHRQINGYPKVPKPVVKQIDERMEEQRD